MDNFNTSQLLQQAIAEHRNANFEAAEDLYNQLLSVEKSNAQILRLFGTLKYQVGDMISARELLMDSYSIDSANTDTLNALGLVFHSLNDYEKSAECFEIALRIEPNHVGVLTNYGVLLSGRENYNDAFAMLNKALSIEPSSPEAIYNFALCLHKLERLDEAEKFYLLLLRILPCHSECLLNLGLIYRKKKSLSMAEEYFFKALSSAPNSVDIKYNIASLRIETNNVAEAEQYLTEVLAANPDYYEALIDLGEINFQRLSFDIALQLFNRAITVNPARWEAYFNAGLAKQEMGLFNESRSLLTTALELAPENQLVQFALSEIEMSIGNFEAGWNCYESRLKFDLFKNRKYPIRKWEGESLEGKSIFVFEEQGSGDTFQFIRYLIPLKENGAVITFHSKPEHLRLLKYFTQIDTIVSDDTTAKSNSYDYYSPLLSIPKILWQKCYELSEYREYLKPPKDLADKWRLNLSTSTNFRVGLFWTGNTFSNINKKRHCNISDLLPLLEIPNIDFFSIQVGSPAQELQSDCFAKNRITDLSGEIADFADTAAIISNMDLIVTIDSSVAHLCGALGKKTFLMAAKVPDWRWIGDGSKSKWYLSITIFRQTQQRVWSNVVSAVKKSILDILNPNQNIAKIPLMLALSAGENFGWGVCSKYLIKEVQQLTKVQIFNSAGDTLVFNGTIFHALQGADLKTLHTVRGKQNIGYTFFENELSDESIENGKQLDLILGGSIWNRNKLKEKGFAAAECLIQGIDETIFYPRDNIRKDSLFTIFSGGKFELRKGQDLVLRAVSILQQKYSDVILVNAWFNIWLGTMTSMRQSKHIYFNPRGNDWLEFVANLCIDNKLDLSRVITLPLTNNNLLPDIYSKTDIGLFPNRCEGGTNLVLMEYMACGKPVIASYNSGHTDVLTNQNSLPLLEQNPYYLYDENNNNLIADWRESSLDEIVSKLEWAYHHRQEINTIGNAADEFMKSFTWKKSAESLLTTLTRAGFV